MTLVSHTERVSTADIDLIQQNTLFHGINFSCVEYMLEYSFIQVIAPGETLLQPDIPNQHLYLVLQGKLYVHLSSNDKLELTELLPGECAGEISLIDGKYPTAIVSAAVNSRVLAIPHYTVWSLVSYSHEIARNLLEIMAGRFRLDNQTIIETYNQKTQFEHQACVDALTGIYNRHWMKNAFPRALSRCAFKQQPFALMLIDVDHFKRINDTYGHLVGDTALKVVTRCLTASLRPYDLLVRYGGEEFLLFLFDADADNAIEIADRLRQQIADTGIHHGNHSFNITVSIGITPTRYNESLQNLINDADQAMYQAKRQGRNQVVMAEQHPSVTS